MSAATEQQLAVRPVVDTVTSAPAKRKRSRSSESEADEMLLSVKKKTLANGETAESRAATETAKKLPLSEKVVILDAGAQYGKVGRQYVSCL